MRVERLDCCRRAQNFRMHYFHLGALNSHSNVDLCSQYRGKNYYYPYFCYCNVVTIIRPLTVTTIPMANMWFCGYFAVGACVVLASQIRALLLVTKTKNQECEVSSSGIIHLPSYSKILLFILKLENADFLKQTNRHDHPNIFHFLTCCKNIKLRAACSV